MPIGANIKKHLEDRNLRQVDLAEAIGVSNGTLSDWIRGRYYPRKKYIDAMANYFRVSPDDLTKENDTNLDQRLVSLFVWICSFFRQKKKKTLCYKENSWMGTEGRQSKADI